MKKTSNYSLNQWEADDKVQRVDFNADNAKIDAALGRKAETSALEGLRDEVRQLAASIPRIIFGTYTGDGTPSQNIVLGFRPRALLVFREDGCASFVSNRLHSCGGLAYPDGPINNGLDTALEITENGFRVCYNNDRYVYCNAKYSFRYIAFL